MNKVTQEFDRSEVNKRVIELIRISHELSEMTGRPFTLDGHLVGSIGEVYAAYTYGIKLYTAGHPLHDGEVNGRKVQIKITQGKRVPLMKGYDLLLVLHLNNLGDIEEVYNGDGKRPFDQAGGAENKRGERSCALSKLRMLKESTLAKDKIHKLS